MSHSVVNKLRAGGIIAAIAITMAFPVHTSAQTRVDKQFSSVGDLRSVGSTVNTFRSYSYGLGAIQSPSPGAGGDMLRSSMVSPSAGVSIGSSALGSSLSSPGSYGVGGYKPIMSVIGVGGSLGSTTLGNPAGVMPDLPSFAKNAMAAGASKIGYTEVGGVGISAMVMALRDTSSIKGDRAYLDAISAAAESSLGVQKAVTSFVPVEPSLYKTRMEGGDRAFRNGDFIRAYNEFQLANDIGDRDPESLLSLTHAAFAKQQYSLAASYLRRAIRYFPELPLVNLKPRGFYGNAATYVDNVIRLEEFLNRSNADSDAYLLLAYFRWFEGNPQDATRCLNLAMGSLSAIEDNKDAIETFWDGMIASGKVKGELKPVTPRDEVRDLMKLNGFDTVDLPAPVVTPKPSSAPSKESATEDPWN